MTSDSEAPGATEPERGGLTAREAYQLMRCIADSKTMCSIEMVEVNPALDRNQMTSRLACDLICAAFGSELAVVI
jgi:arginase